MPSKPEPSTRAERILTWVDGETWDVLRRKAEASPIRIAIVGRDYQTITIQTFDWGRQSIETVYRQILNYAEARGSLRVLTCDSWGTWTMLQKREHRRMSSVFVRQESKDRILSHVEWYLNNRVWFEAALIANRVSDEK